MATSWPWRRSKYFRLCFLTTTEADLLEAAAAAAATLVVTAESSWSTVEIIAQASDDITKVVPKMKTRSIDLCP